MFIFAATLLLAGAQAVYYEDCGSKLAIVRAVSLSNCAEDAKECILKRNSIVTLTVDFTPSVDTSAVEVVVHGIIMNLACPFTMPQPDACKDSGLVCPIKANEKASYSITMPVLKIYPKVKVGVKLELQNSNEQKLVCVIIPAKLQ